MSGKVDRIAGARDIDRSKRASAPDTVIRHRKVARPYVGVLPEGPGSIVGGEIRKGGDKSRARGCRAFARSALVFHRDG
jgi:hypothetical protein